MNRQITAEVVSFVRVKNKSRTGLKRDAFFEKGLIINREAGENSIILDMDGKVIDWVDIHEYHEWPRMGCLVYKDD